MSLKGYNTLFSIDRDRKTLHMSYLLPSELEESQDVIDEISEEELYELSQEEIKDRFPKIYEKYTTKLPIQYLVIKYHYPCISDIYLPYSSKNGFSVRDIAEIIINEYGNFYEEKDDAIKNNRLPKYISQYSMDLEWLSIHFTLDKIEDNVCHISLVVDT